MTIQTALLRELTNACWNSEILPSLIDYIRIPNISVDFDPDWHSHGYMHKAFNLATDWLKRQSVANWKIHDRQLPNRTPLILIEIPGDSDQTILIYGHLDKQPEMAGWREDLGPWKPVIEDDKLYGRGGADDGYALFAAVAALQAIKVQNLPHARLLILIEFSEESGSPDLPDYLEEYAAIIGIPELVIALDSGVGDYKRLWSTTSLRGMLNCTLRVDVLTEAAHSGMASGIVPSSMRIMRQLLDRLEDPLTGAMRIPQLEVEIPPQRQQQARTTAMILGDRLLESFNTVPGLRAVSHDPEQQILNNTWRPTLSVVGQEGMPSLQAAGNVLRAQTAFKLSFRLPPRVDYNTVQQAIHKILMINPPYNANVSVEFGQGGNGWDAPALAPWLEQSTAEASLAYFGQEAAYSGLGGTIPFMAMLGERYPQAQFLITGVLGPKSNAHGPNEFLHIPYAKNLTACVAYIIARHFELANG